MSRVAVQVRDALPEDAPELLLVWAEHVRRTHPERGDGHALQEARTAIARIAADPDERLLVGLLDDRLVAAVHLGRAHISPISADTAVQVNHMSVLPEFRRHGVGRALLEAAVSWAEDKDTGYLLAAAPANSRDANRFMARLGLAQFAVVRGAAVPALRAKLPVEPPACAKVSGRSHRSVGAVLAQRRSQRRAAARSS